MVVLGQIIPIGPPLSVDIVKFVRSGVSYRVDRITSLMGTEGIIKGSDARRLHRRGAEIRVVVREGSWLVTGA